MTGARSAGPFGSLLYEEPPSSTGGEDPAAVSDLNLDQIVEAVAHDREEHDLIAGLLYQPLRDPDVVHYRHEVFRDLQDPVLLGQVQRFSEELRQVRTHLAEAGQMRPRYQREAWFLDAAMIYCDAVRSLADALDARRLAARGLLAFREHLADYVASAAFTELAADTRARKDDLARITYLVRIRGDRVEVSRYGGEADYSAEVDKTFERFQQGAVKDYRVKYRGWPGMHHVGAQILDLVARLFDEQFSALDDYCRRHAELLDGKVRQFERELQFYLAYLDYIEPLRTAGLSFCYPEAVRGSKDVFAKETFDLALASRLVPEGRAVVSNDFHLEGPERVFVVSGPNQGGKTTFARAFGQLHHLAGVGCPVPGSAARLFLPDRIFTHFEREEDLANLSGKLEDDLVRIRDVLGRATGDSILVTNEIFTSTTLRDARFLGRKVLEQVVQLDLLCVYVTFVEELASLGEPVVSMVSTIVPEDPSERTYKVVRGPADGLAHALAIAEKYGLTYERLRERIVS